MDSGATALDGARQPGGDRIGRTDVPDAGGHVPETVRVLYAPAAPLLGRDMLLEARFHGMHFYCGVRVTEVVDETRDGTARVWGSTYETLEVPLERGQVTYEALFVVSCHSKGAPTLDRITFLGWRLFVEAELRGEHPLPPSSARSRASGVRALRREDGPLGRAGDPPGRPGLKRRGTRTARTGRDGPTQTGGRPTGEPGS
ncbi:DUF1990 family protein [Streptomyces cyanogenus]|uniref:Uncharacterized protein n=1 Tax=Streptomyces cyanogenus TaxID=80860 RepID=A0ABX7U1U4_STRCY|nr:DUF1990 family protein [Streptomyces cyanogenus]QTE02995.1 hypothetical protein S1361_37015 [Streptomyces cyanogenus]